MAKTRRNRSDWLRRRNERRIERLVALTPSRFPSAVWTHALGLDFVPETPASAITAYWEAHPIRADRLARALARRSGAPEGWLWHIDPDRTGGVPDTFRMPPLPYREERFAGSGCRVCGRPVFRYGWHRDFWGDGRPNPRAHWHAACVSAWRFWNAPSEQDRLLKRIQRHRCAATGHRLPRDAEVDHRIPLFRVWRDHREMPWPDLLGFWGLPNLQVITPIAHRRKCAAEARERAAHRLPEHSAAE